MTEGLAGRAIRDTARATLAVVGAAIGAWAATAGVREMLRRRAEEALQVAGQTPLGRILPEPELPGDDAAEDDATRIAEAADAANAAAEQAAATLRAAPGNGPDPALPTAAEIGAPGAAAPEADALTAELRREHSVPETPTRADLPLADFDSASLPSLRARLRSLSVEDLVILREWELAHAHRLPVLTMLDNRIAKLASGG